MLCGELDVYSALPHPATDGRKEAGVTGNITMTVGPKAQSAANLKGATAEDAAVDLNFRIPPPSIPVGRGRPVARPNQDFALSVLCRLSLTSA